MRVAKSVTMTARDDGDDEEDEDDSEGILYHGSIAIAHEGNTVDAVEGSTE